MEVERPDAAAEAEDVTARMLEAMQSLEKEHRLRERRNRLVFRFTVVALVVALACLMLGSDEPVLALAAGVAVALVNSVSATYVSRRENAALHELTRWDDRRAIAPLLSIWEIAGPDRKSLIMSLLTRLLPQLQAGDKLLVPLAQRYTLYTLLNSPIGDQGLVMGQPPPLNRTEIEFRIAALKALEQIGDAAALPFVMQIAHNSLAPHALRSAAFACLPFLEQRAEQERISSTLLRPSALGVSPDMLLRASSATDEKHPEQLVRGSSAPAPRDAGA
jgi:hypothetical protein